METKKGDSRMDLAALTASDSNYFDNQDYVFIRRPHNNEPHSTLPTPSHSDALLAKSTSSLEDQAEQEPTPEQQEEPTVGDPVQTTPAKCALNNYCCICTHGLPPSFQSPPTWSEVCRVAMYALEQDNQDRKYFHIRKEICPFIEAHYEVLVPKTKSISWRQTVNMTLSHPQYAHIFMQESQEHEYGRRKGILPGYYCLRQQVDLYKIPEPEKKTRRKRYFDDASTKKKGSKNDDDDSAPSSPTCTSTTSSTTHMSDLSLEEHNTTTTDEPNNSSTEGSGENDPNKPNKKGLIKKLETDLFLYFLERKSLPNEGEALDATLPPLTTPPPVPTPLPSIPLLTSTPTTTKEHSSDTSPNTSSLLPPLSALPSFTSLLAKHASSTPTSTANGPSPSWQPKSGSLDNSFVNWNGKREQEPGPPANSFHSPPSSAFSPKKPHLPFSGKFDMDTPAHEYNPPFPSTTKYSPSSSGKPPSPSNKQPAHFGGLSHMLPPHPPPHSKQSSSPIPWQYDQQSPQSYQYSSSQYPYTSQYPPQSSPYHYSPYQKGLPHPHDQPLPPVPFSSQQPPPSPSTPTIQIHQSPLQQKQQQKQISPTAPQEPPSPSASSKSTTTIQTQQPQRRNRLTTRPWERAILEDYYISFFCQSRHSRREKVKVDELVKKLGWEISRIQRWLDNRRTKDRPRFGHPEFSKSEDNSDDEDKSAKKLRRADSDSPLSSHSPPSHIPPPSKTKKSNKRKGDSDEDGDEEQDPSLSPSSSSSLSPPSQMKKPKPLPSSSALATPPPPNPNQANTDFWVIKNK